MSKENLRETDQLPFKVVFEGIGGENSNYAGIRTQQSFRDEEDFEKFMEESGYKDKVLAKGVTDDEAEELVKDTDPLAYVDAAFAQATKPDGTLDIALLEFQLRNAAWAMAFSERTRQEVKEINPVAPKEKPKLLIAKK